MEPIMRIEQVMAKYTQTVYGVALTHTASRADADDVFQEVFVAYWRSQPQVNSEEHRKAWLIRTTLNFCLKTTQSSWARRTVLLDDARLSVSRADDLPAALNQDKLYQETKHISQTGDIPAVLTSGALHDASFVEPPCAEPPYTESPYAEPPYAELPYTDFLFASEQHTALYAAIRTLAAPYRTVVQLFYFEDLSIAQIAAILGDEQGAVKTRLSRARTQLRKKLTAVQEAPVAQEAPMV